MHCYFHRDLEAVGICKNCGRGLCPACAAEVENGLACRQRCEEEVGALNRITSRSKTAYEKTSGAYARTALFYLALGLAFLLGGIFNWRHLAWLLIPGGVIFTVSAFLHYSTARKFERE
jgi:hypothetical protein